MHLVAMAETKGRMYIHTALIRISSLGCFLFSGLFLLNYHVHADHGIGAGAMNFRERVRGGPENLSSLDLLLFGALMMLAFELLDFISNHSGLWLGSKHIPVRGKHLDDLLAIDRLFIGISKAATGPFVYFYFRYAFFEPNIEWDIRQLSIQNSVLAFISLFVIYDFFYTILHWALHIKSIYGFVHKHHHRQLAPSRGNVDAVNVHPLEYFLGEYNHLLALFLCSQLVVKVHVITSLLFLAIGGMLAGINHTRYDMVCCILGIKIFDSKAHDVHHRIPQSNYGQYTMLWDHIFGTYRPYDPNDRINPDAQLDPKTGKSISYGRKAE